MSKLICQSWKSLLLAGLACIFAGPAGAAQSASLKDILANLEKAPALGSASAPVTIVEFSDFRCSFCKKFWADTLPRLKKIFFEKGTVQFVFRHFAILGKQSEQAALASECAAEQGKFWPYHDKLFANQAAFVFSESKLKEYAGELRLQQGKFDDCLTTGKYKSKVEQETVTAAYLGGRGTPMFLVNEWRLVGAQPFETFAKAIDQVLESSNNKARTSR